VKQPSARRRTHPVYLCLLVPYVVLLCVPLYDRIDPRLFGIPFFYWFQMLWSFLVPLAILPVYLYRRRRRP
jgi:uncharacterized membrane protein